MGARRRNSKGLRGKGLIRAMAEEIHHRGPDDDGVYFGEWFGLGFKRLSILDLSQHGHQPMFDDDKRFLIIVDLKGDQTFVARDQLGIKPIYLYQENDTILFASEIKCFRHHIRFAVNEEALCVNSFDPELKIDPATKIILRRLSRRYFDREFTERRKQGILLPIGDWIRDRKALGRFLDLLTDDTFSGRGYCDPTGVQRRIDGFLRGEQNGLDESLIWGLLRFEVWHRASIDGDGWSDCG